MEGGALHWPLYVPYKLYGEIDHIYGWKAFNAGNGFTSAQGTLNVVESLLYLAYLYLWSKGRASDGSFRGRVGGLALLLGWAAAVMTLSKTVLYCMFLFLSSLSLLRVLFCDDAIEWNALAY
jgi:hypothetical protein